MAVTTTNSRIEEGVLVLTLPENLGSGTVVTRIGTDEEGETVDRVYLYGTHRSLFEVNADNEIVFKGTAQDFEAMPADFSLSLQVVTVNDETGRPTTHTLKNVVVRVADVDEAPTGLTVTGVTDQLNEGKYAIGVKLAEVVVEDDALGTNTLAALPAGSPFEYRAVTRAGAELWLRAGTELDREDVDSLVASIAIDGTTLAATHTLTVLDVNDTDPVIGIGGSRVSLAEGVYGAETDTGIRLTVTDADLNDTAAIRIADDRFSVRESDGAVLIVAGSEFDREAMPLTFVSTLVTAEDAAGNLGQRYLFVGFVDRNDTDPVFGGTGRVEVEENSGAGMVVYDPNVTPDVMGDAVAHSLSGPDAASFTIDAASGELTLTGDPDYESKAVYIVTVTAETRAGKADARSASQHVVVRVRDGNDLPPHIEPVAVAEVAEGSGAGQVVHTPVAAVPDVAGDSVEYTLGGADAGAFTIDGETGALTLTGDPDFEEKSFYTVTITAVTRAGADDEQSAAQSVTLLVLDRPGDELALSASGTQQDLPEGAYTEAAPTGITFGVEGRADLSGIRFRVDDTRFVVGADGGLSVAAGAEFDHEDVADRSIELTVTARDGQGNSGEVVVTVEISNANDEAPEITSQAEGGALDENTEVAAGGVVYRASGTFDATDIAWGIKGGDSALFEMDAATGEVTASSALTPDHEVKSAYGFTLVADSGGLTDELEVVIPVVDLNDHGPRFVKPNKAHLLLRIRENTGAERSLTKLETAPDVEGDAVAYRLIGPGAADFRIDTDTGALLLVPNPDHETMRLHYVQVRAVTREGEDDEQYNDLWVRVDIVNLDDTAPVIARSGTQAALSEGVFAAATPTGYTYSATDADNIGSLTFSVDSDAFEVLADGRLVVVAGAEIDHEALGDGKLPIVVTVTDGAGHTDSDSLDIAIADVEEATLEITSAGTAAALDENTAVAVTDTVYAAAGAATGNTAISWSLKGGDASLFTIGASSGEVRFRAATTPDHEARASYTFTVVAVSGELVEEIDVTVPVTDLNDNPPAFAATGAAEVVEETGAGQVVYTPEAAVPDVEGDAVVYRLSGTDSGHFTIDGGSGALTLTANPDHETRASYSVVITAVTRDGADDERSAAQVVTVSVTDVTGSAPEISRAGEQAALSEGLFSQRKATGYTYTATDADVGDTLTFSASDARFQITASGGLEIRAGSRFDHEGGDGRLTVTVRVTDPEGNSDSDTVVVEFGDVNDISPDITSPGNAAARPENTRIAAGETVYTAAGTHDVTPIRWSIRDGDSGLLKIAPGTGVVSFRLDTVPDHEADSALTFTLVANSGRLTDRASVTIPFIDLNDMKPDFAAKGSAEVEYGTGAGDEVYKPAAATPDVAGDKVVYRLSGPDSGDFTIDENTGALTLREKADEDYSVVITAVTREGLKDQQSAEQVVAIDLEVPVNHPPKPVKTGKQVELGEGTFDKQTQTGYIYTATDPDEGDTPELSVSDERFTITESGQLVIVAGASFDYEAGEGDGEVPLTVTAIDKAGATGSDAISITFEDVNDEAPEITSDDTGTTLPENTGVGTDKVIYTAKGKYDATQITWSISGADSARLDIDSTKGVVKFKAATTPDHEAKSTYTFTVRADSGGLTDTLDVTVPVKDLNDNPPAFTATGAAEVVEETGAGQVVYTPEAAMPDVDGDAVVYRLSGPDSGDFTIDENTGALTLREKADEDYSVVITAVTRENQSDVQSASQAVTIKVTQVKAPIPTSPGELVIGPENTTISSSTAVYTAKGTHTSKITWSIKGVDASSFNIHPDNGKVTFKVDTTPDFEAKSEYTFTLVASTTDSEPGKQAVTLTVTDVNEAPTPFVPSSVSIDEGAYGADTETIHEFRVLDEDAGDSHTFTTDDSRFEIRRKQDGTFKLFVTAGSEFDFEKPQQSVSFGVTVTDSGNLSGKETVLLSITDVNEAPTPVVPSSVSIDEGAYGADTETIHEFRVLDEDAGDSHTFTTDDSRFEIRKDKDGKYKLFVTAGSEFDFEEPEQSVSFGVTVTDSGNLSGKETVLLSITDVNEAPTPVVPASASIDEGAYGADTETFYEFSVSDEDAGDSHTFTTDDSRFEIRRKQDGTFKLFVTAGSEFDFEEPEQSVSLGVTVTDSGNLSGTETLLVSITNVNEAPTPVVPTSIPIAEGVFSEDTDTGFIFKVSDEDVGDSHAFTTDDSRFEIRGKKDGTFTLYVTKGTEFDYESLGTDKSVSFKVTVTDADGLKGTKEAKVAITDVVENGPPTVPEIDPQRASIEQPWTFRIPKDGFSDPDGDRLWFTVTSAGGGELPSWLNHEDLILSGTPGKEDYGTHNLDITVRDREVGGLTASVTFAVQVIEKPSIELVQANVSLSETAAKEGSTVALTSDRFVANISVKGVLGTSHEYQLSGEDQDNFTIKGDKLYLKAGTILDYESKTAYQIAVTRIGETKGGPTNEKLDDVTASFNLNVTNLVEPIVITSGGSASSLTENDESAPGALVYSATGIADQNAEITWSIDGNLEDDAESFKINPTSGAVTFTESSAPDHERKSDYAFTVVASAAGQTAVSQRVTLKIIDQPDNPPLFPAHTFNVDENAKDDALKFVVPKAMPDVAGDDVTYRVIAGSDVGYFTFSVIGDQPVFVLKSSPDHESKASYTVELEASTEGESNGIRKSAVSKITILVNDQNDHAPVLGSNLSGIFFAWSFPYQALENGWMKMLTLTGTPDVAGDEIEWRLKEGDTNRIKITDEGVVWLKIGGLSTQSVSSFNGTVAGSVGGLEADAGLVLVYGSPRPYLDEGSDEEDGDEDGGEPDDEEDGDDGSNEDDDGNAPSNTPTVSWFDDGYF